MQDEAKPHKLFIGEVSVWNSENWTSHISEINFSFLVTVVHSIGSTACSAEFLEFQMVHLVKELGKTALQMLVALSAIEDFLFSLNGELSVAWAIYNGKVWAVETTLLCIYLLRVSPQSRGLTPKVMLEEENAHEWRCHRQSPFCRGIINSWLPLKASRSFLHLKKWKKKFMHSYCITILSSKRDTPWKGQKGSN